MGCYHLLLHGAILLKRLDALQIPKSKDNNNNNNNIRKSHRTATLCSSISIHKGTTLCVSKIP